MIENDSKPKIHQSPPAVDINIRLTNLTKDIRRLADDVKQKGTTPSKYRLDTYAELNRQKGGIIAEALVYQAQSPDQPFFTTHVEEGEDPFVVFTIPDQKHPRGRLRTKTRMSNIRLPGLIETSEDALTYLQGKVIPCPQEADTGVGVNGSLPEEPLVEDTISHLPEKELPVVTLNAQQLVEIGKQLEYIDQYKEKADRDQANPATQDRWRQLRKSKHDVVFGKVLPARRGKLPEGFEVIVDLQKDALRKSKRDRVRIIIRNYKHAFQTLLYTGEMGGKAKDEMMWLIGEFDHEYEVDFDAQKQRSQRK